MKTLLKIVCLSLLLGRVAIAAEPTPEDWKKQWGINKEAEKSGICQAHKVKMTPTSVPIRYGLPGPHGKDEPSTWERLISFPHAQKYQEGGCCPIPDETTATVPICAECEKAEAAWLAARKKAPKPAPAK